MVERWLGEAQGGAMQTFRRSIGLGLALVLTAGLAAAEPTESEKSPAADPVAGAAKAATCGGCHGPDGNALNPAWPKLAGQQPGYLVKQLSDFQSARRLNPIMSAMAAPLTPQDIADVSAHFASLPVLPAAAQPADGGTDPVADSATTVANNGTAGASDDAGARLYREGRPESGVLPCASCHGLLGEGFAIGVDGGFPSIGSQNGAYLEAQLRAFRDGTRANDWEGLMQQMAAGLTDKDIGALAAYLSRLPRGSAAPTAPPAAGG